MFRRSAWLILLLILAGSGLVLLLSPGDYVHAQVDRPIMPNMDPASRMAPPPMSDPPTQLEWGHYNYWLSCMVCHGDRGQGLTDEWRTAGNPDGENCWQARCHAASHPPEGFELPRYVPPVLGEYAQLRFQTVGDLQAYLQETMPWYAPGLLEEEIYWQLAAYLADANGTPDIPNNPDWAVLANHPLREMSANGTGASMPSGEAEPLSEDKLTGAQSPNSVLILFVGMGLLLVVSVFIFAQEKRTRSTPRLD